MMYKMTKKDFHQLLDGLHLVLVVDVREGVQHVSEVLKIILNIFPFKNYAEMTLVRVSQHVSKVLKIILNGLLIKTRRK